MTVCPEGQILFVSRPLKPCRCDPFRIVLILSLLWFDTDRPPFSLTVTRFVFSPAEKKKESWSYGHSVYGYLASVVSDYPRRANGGTGFWNHFLSLPHSEIAPKSSVVVICDIRSYSIQFFLFVPFARLLSILLSLHIWPSAFSLKRILMRNRIRVCVHTHFYGRR